MNSSLFHYEPDESSERLTYLLRSKYIKTSWCVSRRRQVVSVMYYKCDSALLFYSAVIRLTGRGHHYDWLQRERGKTTCLAFEIQFHRRSKLIPLTPANRHILIIMSPSHILSCIGDKINRDGQQLPPRGIMSSLCPQACWQHRDNRLWQ